MSELPKVDIKRRDRLWRADEIAANFISKITVKRGTGGERDLAPLLEVWREIVGESAARNGLIVSLKDGVLLVKTAGSVWRQEFSLQVQTILPRLQERFPDLSIRSIRFK